MKPSPTVHPEPGVTDTRPTLSTSHRPLSGRRDPSHTLDLSPAAIRAQGPGPHSRPLTGRYQGAGTRPTLSASHRPLSGRRDPSHTLDLSPAAIRAQGPVPHSRPLTGRYQGAGTRPTLSTSHRPLSRRRTRPTHSASHRPLSGHRDPSHTRPLTGRYQGAGTRPTLSTSHRPLSGRRDPSHTLDLSPAAIRAQGPVPHSRPLTGCYQGAGELLRPQHPEVGLQAAGGEPVVLEDDLLKLAEGRWRGHQVQQPPGVQQTTGAVVLTVQLL